MPPRVLLFGWRIELDMAWYLSDFLIAELEKDYLCMPDSQLQDAHRPVCGMVCGDGTSAQQ